MMLTGFEKLSNTRDLGGIKTKNNKVIKSCKLIRSGRLFFATENDIDKLVNVYHLKRIIDFRNKSEVLLTPDPVIDNVINIACPLQKERTNIDSNEKKVHKIDIDYIKHSIQKMDFDVEDKITNDYLCLLESEYSINQLRHFFKLLLIEVNGATLYHCSAGKDRVGISTVLLLGILGVDENTLRLDYLKTNTYLQWRLDNYSNLAKEKGIDEKYLLQLPALVGVKESYIDSILEYINENYDSITNYATEILQLSLDDIEKLRSIYLE
jgi:protein-tyrosine phosphatase